MLMPPPGKAHSEKGTAEAMIAFPGTTLPKPVTKTEFAELLINDGEVRKTALSNGLLETQDDHSDAHGWAKTAMLRFYFPRSRAPYPSHSPASSTSFGGSITPR